MVCTDEQSRTNISVAVGATVLITVDAPCAPRFELMVITAFARDVVELTGIVVSLGFFGGRVEVYVSLVGLRADCLKRPRLIG